MYWSCNLTFIFKFCKVLNTMIENLYTGCTSIIKYGSVISEEFPIIKEIKTVAVAPILIKVYLQRALKNS